jgi:hypothetical protein
MNELFRSDYFRDFISGVISGSVGVIVSHPFDTIKVYIID